MRDMDDGQTTKMSVSERQGDREREGGTGLMQVMGSHIGVPFDMK